MPQDTPAEALSLESKITGAEFRDFYQNHWPKGWYVDEMQDGIEDDSGRWLLPDDAAVKLDDLGWARRNSADGFGGETKTIGEMYLEFKAGTSGEIIASFRLPQDKLEELEKAAAALGATKI